jgi:acyl-CoA synthetase (AMP-forming)/AMP-acid ligase II
MPQRKSLASLALTVTDDRFIADDHGRVPLYHLRGGSCFASVTLNYMRDRVVLLATTRQLPSILTAIELDGIAKRILLCTPDLASHLPIIVKEAKVDYIVSDEDLLHLTFQHSEIATLGLPLFKAFDKIVSHGYPEIKRDIETEWILFTSGTTGRPKMVSHTLASLSGPLADGTTVANGTVWSTFYDTRRYGGMQILLRALIGGGSMILSSQHEPVGAFLTRLATDKVSHISGTPSHWRRALLNRSIGSISPAYIRMSGEVADQAILDRLAQTFPNANIAHAFASTEAGVAFDVRDGLAGFPIALLHDSNDHVGVEMRIEDNTLRIRSSRTASGYLGQSLPITDGFIDTGDMVEQRGDRYYFVGRKEGVINVGGNKVYPEEVENIITQHPAVQIARVWARKSPITGSIVAADVVLTDPTVWPAILEDLKTTCRQALAPYKIPVTWFAKDSIAITPSGKVQRV